MHRTLIALLMALSGAGLACGSSGVIRDSAPSLESFLHACRSAPGDERSRLLERFWSDVLRHGTPLVGNPDTTARFLFRGPGAAAGIIGDMTQWKRTIPMEHLEGTDLFHLTLSFPAEARFDYLIVDGRGDTIVDPANPRKVPGGYGERSELVMPAFVPSRVLTDSVEREGGTLTTLALPGVALGYEHTVRVYLPPGYGASDARYPVAYFQDGDDYLNFAGARRTLDVMITRGLIRPVMAVFIVPPALPERNRRTEYAMNDAYAKFLAAELVPRIDREYRTLARPPMRLLVGPSFGGLISLYTAFRHPGVFGAAASQSGYAGFGRDSLIALFASVPARPIRIYLDCGTFETDTGPGTGGERDFLAGNRRLRDVLERQHYAFTYREFPDGHSWGRWRNELPAILLQFFPWLR